jgi:hypothetical protein
MEIQKSRAVFRTDDCIDVNAFLPSSHRANAVVFRNTSMSPTTTDSSGTTEFDRFSDDPYTRSATATTVAHSVNTITALNAFGIV